MNKLYLDFLHKLTPNKALDLETANDDVHAGVGHWFVANTDVIDGLGRFAARDCAGGEAGLDKANVAVTAGHNRMAAGWALLKTLP